MLTKTRFWLGFASAVATIGLFVTGFWVYGLGIAQGRFQPDAWAETDCIILAVDTIPPWSVMTADSDFSPAVRYEFEVGGKHRQGTRFAEWPERVTLDFEQAEALLVNLRPGTRTTCWVNVTDPSRAVLHMTWGPPRWSWLLAGVAILLLCLFAVARWIAADGVAPRWSRTRRH
ncbi:MAG: DUF3592 domain-containing protein [Planctomycetales bacterium]|nr:DUF3592 domain-containing protein [Planctomycetales bacterium]